MGPNARRPVPNTGRRRSGVASRFTRAAGIIPVALLISCALDSRVDTIVLRFPEIPPTWHNAYGLRYDSNFRDAAGSQIDLDAAPGDGIPIAVKRGRAQAFLARPYIKDYLWPGILAPAGAVYPGELDGDELRLTWEGGLGASAARILEASGYPIGMVDWPRIAVEAKGRAGDPWAIGPRPIAAALLAGSFGISALRANALIPVRVPLSAGRTDSAPGSAESDPRVRKASWAADSPFAPQPVEDGDVYGFCVPGERCFFDGDRAVRFSLDLTGRIIASVETRR